MYSYGERSTANRATLDPRLQQIADEMIKIIDVSILYGHRTNQEQDDLWRQGREKQADGSWKVVGATVTKTPAGKSKHNLSPSPAMDIAPYPINYENGVKKLARFYFMAGIAKGVAAQLGIKIRGGWDWDGDNDFEDQTFDDLAHIELVD